MRRLSDKEIATRMGELHNLRRLHAHDRAQITQLKAENKLLRERVATQQSQLDKQAIQIAELQTMVFGKKKKPPTGTVIPVLPEPLKQPRSKASYHRPIPPASAVTTEVMVSLPETCPHCGKSGAFDDATTIHHRYQEDIPLPELTPGYYAKLVTKYSVAKGVCRQCGKPSTGTDPSTVQPWNLGGAQVSLGPNIRLLVTHLIAGVGMSYAQVTHLLLSLYGLTISSGEIATILHKQHQTWLPAYHQLKSDIRAAPVVHGDETPWPIQDLQGAGYAWNICDAASAKVCYAFEQSRGVTYAKRLFGQDTEHPFAGTRVTDDYGAYRSADLPGTQQLCWAHLYRTIRDLRYNVNLPAAQLVYVSQWYEVFAAIYQDLRLYLSEPYDPVTRDTQSQELWGRVKALAEQAAPPVGEPDKLRRLKAQLLRAGKDRLFVCLPKDTPCDNNRAERDLRQLVLKRKRSFGSKSERGATALATVLSLCTTTWRTSPDRYFSRLAALA